MVAELEESRIEAERLDLRDNDRVVLELLRSEPSAAVGFQGLRRRLRLHPERLSRALHRLAEDDLVVRTELGYRVSPRGLAILSPDAFPRGVPGVPVLQAYLPGDVDLRSLTLALKGSWIGPPRGDSRPCRALQPLSPATGRAASGTSCSSISPERFRATSGRASAADVSGDGAIAGSRGRSEEHAAELASEAH